MGSVSRSNTSLEQADGSATLIANGNKMVAVQEETPPMTTFQKCLNFRGLGLCAVFLSSIFYTTNAVLVKMSGDLHPIEVALFRFSVQFILLLPLLTYKRNEHDILGKPGMGKLLWLRGACGGIGVMCFYLAIWYLPVADAVTLAYSRMMMIPFLARIFLHEKLSYLELCLAVLSLFGVVLIAKPAFLFPESSTSGGTNPIGVMFGLLAALFQGVSMVVVRKLGDTYPPLNVGYYSVCGGVLSMSVLAAFQEFRYPCYHNLPILFALGFVGVFAQYFLTIGLQRERAGSVAVLLSVQLILINIVQVILLAEVPSLFSIIGTGLILISSIILGVRNGLKKEKSEK